MCPHPSPTDFLVSYTFESGRDLPEARDLVPLYERIVRSGKKIQPKCLGVIWFVLCDANELESFEIYWDYLQLESSSFLAFVWGIYHIERYPSVHKDAGGEAYQHSG